MSNVLVVLGSARTGRVADKVASYVLKDIENREGVSATVADLKEIDLPFFNNENPPASPAYDITDEKVLAWQKMVVGADSVIFITPEYNHSLSAIQKNAIDTLGKEWEEKPVTAVAYGWSGGSLSLVTFREVMTHLKSKLGHDIAQLSFMKDINPDGTIIDQTAVEAAISAAIDEVA